VDALIAAEKEVQKAFPNQPEIQADVFAEMASTLARLGEYDRAERHARDALRIRQQTLGESHIDTLSAQSNLGHILSQPVRGQPKSQYEEARKLLDQAISALRADPRAPPVHLFDTLNNRAALAFNEGDFSVAEQFTLESLAWANRNLGADSSQAIFARQNLAILLGSNGKLEDSERELRQVAQLLQQAHGDRNPATLEAYRAHALSLAKLERNEEAEEIYRRCLPIAREVLGETHDKVASWMNDYAYLLYSLQRHAEAVEKYREALQHAEAALGPSSFLVIAIKDSLAHSLVALNRPTEAEPLFRECVTRLSETRGPAAESTLRETCRLVDVLIRNGEFEEAVTMSRQTQELAEQSLASDTGMAVICRAVHARSLLAAGRLDDARPLIPDLWSDLSALSPEARLAARPMIDQLTDACKQAGIETDLGSGPVD
jgi:eukaryotic-like serine/threonine-protein kinase